MWGGFMKGVCVWVHVHQQVYKLQKALPGTFNCLSTVAILFLLKHIYIIKGLGVMCAHVWICINVYMLNARKGGAHAINKDWLCDWGLMSQ